MLRIICFVVLSLAIFSAQSAATVKFVFTYEGSTFSTIIDEFSRSESVPVERVWTAQGDLRVNLLELIERGNAPDVVLIPGDHVGLYDLMQYSQIDQSLQIEAIEDRLWQSAQSDGKIFGVPVVQGNQLMLYYNKKWIKQPAKTWQDMLAQHQTFLSQLGEKPARFIAWSYEEMYWLAPFFQGFGGRFFNQDNQIDLNTPAMVSALDLYKSLADQKIVDPLCTYACAHEAFIAGKLAYTINGDWAFKEFSQNLGENLGIAKLPAISENQPLVPLFASHILAFPNNSLTGPKAAQLQKLIRYFEREDVQKQIWQELKVLPVNHKVYQQIYQLAAPLEKQMLTTLNDALPMPTAPSMTAVWSAMRKGFIRHQAGVMSAQEAAQLMQQIAEKQSER